MREQTERVAEQEEVAEGTAPTQSAQRRIEVAQAVVRQVERHEVRAHVADRRERRQRVVAEAEVQQLDGERTGLAQRACYYCFYL